MMEKATENFLFRVSRRTGREETEKGLENTLDWRQHRKKSRRTVHMAYLCHAEGCTSRSLHSIGAASRGRREENFHERAQRTSGAD